MTDTVPGWRTILPSKVVSTLDRCGIEHCEIVDYCEKYHDMTDSMYCIAQYRITKGDADILLTYEKHKGHQQEFHQFILAAELSFELGACSVEIRVAFDLEESERVLTRAINYHNSLVHFSHLAVEPIIGALRD